MLIYIAQCRKRTSTNQSIPRFMRRPLNRVLRRLIQVCTIIKVCLKALFKTLIKALSLDPIWAPSAQTLALRIVAELLQIAAWLLLTGHYKLINALSDGTIAAPATDACSPKTGVSLLHQYPKMHGALGLSCISAMVIINRLQTFANALSNTFLADHSFYTNRSGIN